MYRHTTYTLSLIHIFEEEKIALFAVGSMVKTAVEVREALKEKGVSCTVVNARFVKPIDENMVPVSYTHLDVYKRQP